MVALATIIDTCFGVWKAKKLKEPITSKMFRNGLVPKLVSYIAVVMLVYSSDVFIINGFNDKYSKRRIYIYKGNCFGAAIYRG
jgi:hypothetical protein